MTAYKQIMPRLTSYYQACKKYNKVYIIHCVKRNKNRVTILLTDLSFYRNFIATKYPMSQKVTLKNKSS